MKSRDSKGRFSKQAGNEGLVLTLPTIQTILYYLVLIFIFLPWLIIVTKFNLFEKISSIFDSIFKDTENTEQNKKNGIFY